MINKIKKKIIRKISINQRKGLKQRKFSYRSMVDNFNTDEYTVDTNNDSQITRSGNRKRYTITRKDLLDKPSVKALTSRIYGGAARNNQGRKTIIGRSTRLHKRKYRILAKHILHEVCKYLPYQGINYIDATVIALEYDPNRSAYIALLKLQNGKDTVCYICAEQEMFVGKVINIGQKGVLQKPGNITSLRYMSDGSNICYLEPQISQGARMVMSAGNTAMLVSKNESTGYGVVRLSSGEERRVHLDCGAMYGQISNIDHNQQSMYKAGQKRYIGRRPRASATTKNATDHPLGGTSKGRASCNKNGNMRKGQRTASKKIRRASRRLIIKSRHRRNKR